MTDTYKILGQAVTGNVALDNATAIDTVVYEVPQGTQSSVSAIEITNSHSVQQTYKLAFVPSSEKSLANATITYQVPSVETKDIVLVGGYQIEGMMNYLPKYKYTYDGNTWMNNTGISIVFNNVIRGNGKFLAVSFSNPYVYFISTNGITWTQASLPYGYYIQLMYFANNKFIAFDSSGYAWNSTDGLVWIRSNNASSLYRIGNIKYGNGVYVQARSAQYTTTIFYSYDGLEWNETYLPATNGNYSQYHMLTYANGVFSLIGWGYDSRNHFYRSTDGVNWEETHDQDFGIGEIQWKFLEYYNGLFIGINNRGYAVTSSDGINYSKVQQSYTDGQYLDSNGLPTLTNDGIFMMAQNGIYAVINPSYPGGSITYNSPDFYRNLIIAPSTYGRKYIAFGENKVYKSDDLLSWTSYDIDINYIQWKSQGSVQTTTYTTNTQTISQSLNKHVAIYNKTIYSGETHEIKGGITLSAGDQIRVASGSPEIIVNVYGAEIV